MDFDREQWALVLKDAGIKYMVFTTKHHDGFCMYDSDYTDFNIAKAGPFTAPNNWDFTTVWNEVNPPTLR